MSTEYKTLEEVKRDYPKWFEPETMRFFGSTIETKLHAGRYFITSEQYEVDYPRKYTVREVTSYGISTVGEFQKYGTFDGAYTAMMNLI